jgi:hypothetical protein
MLTQCAHELSPSSDPSFKNLRQTFGVDVAFRFIVTFYSPDQDTACAVADISKIEG